MQASASQSPKSVSQSVWRITKRKETSAVLKCHCSCWESRGKTASGDSGPCTHHYWSPIIKVQNQRRSCELYVRHITQIKEFCQHKRLSYGKNKNIQKIEPQKDFVALCFFSTTAVFMFHILLNNLCSHLVTPMNIVDKKLILLGKSCLNEGFACLCTVVCSQVAVTA